MNRDELADLLVRIAGTKIKHAETENRACEVVEEFDRLTAEVERWTTGYNGLMKVIEKQDAELSRLRELTRRHGPDEVPPMQWILVEIMGSFYQARRVQSVNRLGFQLHDDEETIVFEIDGWYCIPGEAKHD